MAYFCLTFASFKHCKEKFQQKSFLGESVKVLTGHVSALSNQGSLGIKETFAEKYFFKSRYYHLQAMLKCQDQHLMNSKWLGGIFSKRAVHH